MQNETKPTTTPIQNLYTFTEAQINTILSNLSEVPAKYSMQIINMIQSVTIPQYRAQNQKKTNANCSYSGSKDRATKKTGSKKPGPVAVPNQESAPIKN